VDRVELGLPRRRPRRGIRSGMEESVAAMGCRAGRDAWARS
jgi:hypothetical protein